MKKVRPSAWELDAYYRKAWSPEQVPPRLSPGTSPVVPLEQHAEEEWERIRVHFENAQTEREYFEWYFTHGHAD